MDYLLQNFEELLSYWHDLPKDEFGVPRRSQFRAMHLPHLVPHMFVLERLSRYEGLMRMSGSEMEAQTEQYTTSKILLKDFPRDEWEQYADFSELILSHPCGGKVARTVSYRGNRVMDSLSLCLPFSDDEGVSKFQIGLFGSVTNHNIQPPSDQETQMKTMALAISYFDIGFGCPD